MLYMKASVDRSDLCRAKNDRQHGGKKHQAHPSTSVSTPSVPRR